MPLEWVAGSVRARLIARRRIGRAGARGLAAASSLEDALASLGSGPYGRDLHPGLDLVQAQRAIASTALWHVRVVAGWLPPEASSAVRALAGWFEIANVEDRLAYFAGGPRFAPYELGRLGLAWQRLSQTTSGSQMRAVLAGSRWGDPGGDDAAAIASGMRRAWASRVRALVPAAIPWVEGAATIAGARQAGDDVAGFARGLRSDRRWPLAGIETSRDLWRAEAEWWRRVEVDSLRMIRGFRHGMGVAVGAIGLLGADAWRTSGALAAAGGDETVREVLYAMA